MRRAATDPPQCGCGRRNTPLRTALCFRKRPVRRYCQEHWVYEMLGVRTFTFLAHRTAFSPPPFSFQAHRETWPFGRRSLAHLRTLTEPDWFELSTIPEARIASASQSDTGRLIESVARRRTYPFPNRNDPWGKVGSGSRSGIFALIAFIWAR